MASCNSSRPVNTIKGKHMTRRKHDSKHKIGAPEGRVDMELGKGKGEQGGAREHGEPAPTSHTLCLPKPW